MLAKAAGDGGEEVLALEALLDLLALGECAGVVPGDRLDWWLIERAVQCDIGTRDVPRRERAIALDVDLLDATEAAKLALGPVVEAVVIRVARRERRAAPAIRDCDLGHAVHRERQARDPGSPRAAVLEIELRRRRVGD